MPTPLPSSATVTDSGGVELAARVEPPSVEIGQPFVLDVTIRAPASTAVSAPVLDGARPEVDVRSDFQPSGRTERDGRQELRFRAELQAFALGPQELPQGELIVRDASGDRSLELPRLSVAVESVLHEKNPRLRGAKGLWSLPPWLPGWVVALVIALLVSLLLLWWWRRRPRRPRATREVELSWDERALHDLRELAASPLLRSGRVKEFHVRLSTILRTALGARYGFDAMEMTSDELGRALRHQGMPPQLLEAIRRLSRISDLVKFARVEPPTEEHERALQMAVRLVETIRRPPPPVERVPLARASAGRAR